VGSENFPRYNIPTVQGGVPMTVKETKAGECMKLIGLLLLSHNIPSGKSPLTKVFLCFVKVITGDMGLLINIF
jgi:hypothetical protein